MKVAIITTIAGQSSAILATALKNNGVEAKVFNLKLVDKYDFREYDYVFAYGCSADVRSNKRINTRSGVITCVSKPKTFDILTKHKIPTVAYCTDRALIPKHWETVVIRTKINGRKAEGLDYHENNKDIPNGKLFSEYFEHKFEYRIMVFMGEVVGRYFKKEDKGDWYFNRQPKKGFEAMDAQCILAAKALGIDYVGFDVVANTKQDFRILEANSGPRITDEAENAIVEYFINL